MTYSKSRNSDVGNPQKQSGSLDGAPTSTIASAGNLAIQRKCRSCSEAGGFQIGASDAPEEAEADRIASLVVRRLPIGPLTGSGGGGMRRCSCGAAAGSDGMCEECAAKQDEQIQRAISSGGQQIEPTVRREMEGAFGADFSGVQVHSGSDAARSASSIQARAYTLGNHIVMGENAPGPESSSGKELLAHELTHVVQQGSAGTVRRDDEPQDAGAPTTPADSQSADAGATGSGTAAAVSDGGQTPDAGTQASGTASAGADGGSDAGGGSGDGGGSQDGGGQSAGDGGGGGGGGATEDTTSPCVAEGYDWAQFNQKISALGIPTRVAKRDSKVALGQTTLNQNKIVWPQVATEPVTGGVKLKPTAASLPSIPTYFTQAGDQVVGDVKSFQQQGSARGCKGDMNITFKISDQGAAKIAEGELEHCSDYQLAFDLSLRKFALAVNALAGKTIYRDNDQAWDSVHCASKVDPAKWKMAFQNLVNKSRDRDTFGWHTPSGSIVAPSSTNCQAGYTLVVGGNSFRNIPRPSAQVITTTGVPEFHEGAGKACARAR